MKLLYAGAPECDDRTLKRLMAIGEELAFMDRPSVAFETWGTIGRASMWRNVTDAAEGPVPVRVFGAPSGPARLLHQPYVDSDLSSPEFMAVVMAGLKRNGRFARRLLPPDAQYAAKWGRTVSGEEVRAALVADGLASETVSVAEINVGRLYDMSTVEGRAATLKSIVTEVSIEVTSTMLVAESSGFLPVCDEEEMWKLLALRSDGSRYVGGATPVAAWVGLVMARSVIPDAVLDDLSTRDILDYRASVTMAYGLWRDEVNAVAARLAEIPPDELKTEGARLIASEVVPRVRAYEAEMAGARDKMFGDMLRQLATVRFPVLSLAYASVFNLPLALAGFAGLVTPALPGVVDYYNARRDISRRHGVGFLVGLSNAARVDEDLGLLRFEG
jgi:hypothetical protein